MCGIYGLVGFGPGLDAAGEVTHALRTLHRRGPDGGGIVATPLGAFGLRRLRIVDVAGAPDLPMWDAAGDHLIAYNGEVFNHGELRHELERAGAAFHTQCDTEVVLQAYRRWGRDCVERLRGMFAFAILDLPRRRLFLARDRLGVKPLYFAGDGQAFRFASTATAIAEATGRDHGPSRDAMRDFLMFRTPLGSASMFDGIRRLEPGHHLTVDRAGVVTRRYWSPPIGPDSRDDRPAIEPLIRSAVCEQMQSERPASLLLSGGLDSSILCAEASDQAQTRAFSAHLPGFADDESVMAALVARRTGTLLTPVTIDAPTGPDDIAALQRERGQPLGMHNEWAMHRLAAAVARHGPVTLCGEGADELFGGYGRLERLAFDWRRTRAAARFGAAGHAAARHWHSVDLLEARSLTAAFLGRYRYTPMTDVRRLFGLSANETEDLAEQQEAQFANVAEGEARDDDRIVAILVRLHLPGLLEMVDATLMSASVEGRVPFCDHRLAEAALGLPRDRRVRWRSATAALRAQALPVARFSERFDETKVALRDAYRDRLPAAVLQRRKIGFAVSLAEWLAESGLDRMLESDELRLWDHIDRAPARAMLDGLRRAPSDARARRVWMLVNLEIFLQWTARL